MSIQKHRQDKGSGTGGQIKKIGLRKRNSDAGFRISWRALITNRRGKLLFYPSEEGELYPTIPPQGPYFRSKDSSNDAFFKPANNLLSIGRIKTLTFKGPYCPYFPLRIINPSVDVKLE